MCLCISFSIIYPLVTPNAVASPVLDNLLASKISQLVGNILEEAKSNSNQTKLAYSVYALELKHWNLYICDNDSSGIHDIRLVAESLNAKPFFTFAENDSTLIFISTETIYKYNLMNIYIVRR